MKGVWKAVIFVSVMLTLQSNAQQTVTHPGSKTSVPHRKCVQLFYDHPKMSDGSNYLKGRLYIIGIQNLVGHFRQIQPIIIPIERYQAGQLERCEANIYIGTYFNNKLPKAFLDDFVTTKKNVAWLGYNLVQLGDDNLKALWSVSYGNIGKTDWSKTDQSGRPGVYNSYTYKGETFERCHYPFEQNTVQFKNHYTYDYDIALLNPINANANKFVQSWGLYSLSDKKTPYVLRNENHWYVADNPLKFICEGDRYFIFADILFDILNEPPVNGGKKYAFVRYEDVSPRQAPSNITTLAKVFSSLRVPYAISVIPIYTDPLGIYKYGKYIEATDRPVFLQALQYASENGASFIMHGVSHQYGSRKNPFSGVSAEDFEFWDKSINGPVKEDSTAYILDRLNKGVGIFNAAKIKFSAWMTAHYAASALDNIILGEVFTWNVGRGNYDVVSINDFVSIPESLTYDQAGIDDKSNAERLKLLTALKVKEFDSQSQLNQIFPYEIYSDYYHRRMLPENLGNVQPFLNNQVITRRSVEDIIKDAKRYTVLRDTWAAFFIHDLLLNTVDKHGLAKKPGDTSELQRMIQTIKDYGYEFIDLKTWVTSHTYPKSPEAIEPYPPY